MSGMCEVRNIVIGEGMPKICVPIVGSKKEDIIKEALIIKDKKPDLVEWRVDFFSDIESKEKVNEVLEKLRDVLKEIPLLFTIRTSNEGGEKILNAEEYIEINQNAINSGYIDLVDVETFMNDNVATTIVAIAAQKGVKVVGSNHNFKQTPDVEDILKRLEKMDSYGCDIVKIALMPNDKGDVIKVLEATLKANENINKPIVTMSMGKCGVVSRMIGECFGSAITFASVNKASAPGQIEISMLREILNGINKVGV